MEHHEKGMLIVLQLQLQLEEWEDRNAPPLLNVYTAYVVWDVLTSNHVASVHGIIEMKLGAALRS